jgi:hypothetical protein
MADGVGRQLGDGGSVGRVCGLCGRSGGWRVCGFYPRAPRRERKPSVGTGTQLDPLGCGVMLGKHCCARGKLMCQMGGGRRSGLDGIVHAALRGASADQVQSSLAGFDGLGTILEFRISRCNC